MKGIQGNDETSVGRMISHECATAVFEILVSERILLSDMSLDLDASKEQVKMLLDANIPSSYRKEYHRNESLILDTVMRSRFVNLYYLLRVRSNFKECSPLSYLIVALISTLLSVLFIPGPSFRGILRCHSEKPNLGGRAGMSYSPLLFEHDYAFLIFVTPCFFHDS